MRTSKILLCIAFIITGLSVFAQNGLTGKVSDSANGSGLPGAVVYIPDLKVAAQTNSDGSYTISNIPKGTFVVEVHILGYKVISEAIKIDGIVNQNYSLIESEFQEDEVVVTGNSKASEAEHNPQPTTDVTNEYLNQHSSTNVIDAIATAPGVAVITDGQSIGKPIIRGLGYNRVLTINDGVEQVDQPWFDEFGIEADPDAVNRYEILKGPGSLAYGSDAISGVLNLIPEDPLPAGQIKGDVLFNYQSNNGLINNMAHIAGTTMGGISWSARVDNTMAHAYQNPYDGYVLNSQFSNFNADGTIGIHKSWGYSQLHASYFYMNTGIVDGTRDSVGNQLMPVYYTGITPTAPFPFAYVEPNQQDEKTYTPFVIYQYIHHYKLVWDNSIALGNGAIKAIFSYQRNQRQEMNDPTQPNVPIIYYNSNALTYDVRYVAPQIGNFNFSVGANGVYQDSKSLGFVQLIPDYNYMQIGGFAIASEKIGKLNLSGGIRYDTRTFTGEEHWVSTDTLSPQEPVAPNTPNSFEEFVPFTTTFSGMSGSFGATYDFTKTVYAKANIARGWRAPNVNECAANGVHDGTVVYEIGDPNIKPETSLEEDIAFGVNSKDVNFEVDGFINTISNFIYARGLLSANGGDSTSNALSVNGTLFPDAPVFKYENGNAQLEGGEMTLDIHPSGLKWLEINSTLSYVTGGLTGVSDSTKYLPFVPPMRITADLILHFGKVCSFIKDAYVRFGVMNVAQQSNVYREAAIYTALSSSSTPYEYAASQNAEAGYTLFNAGLGGHILNHRGKEACEIFVICNNLTNVGYMDYMSRFKYYPYNPSTNRVGVFNMGRNISVKLIIPINFSEKSSTASN
ncbi:MAG TPA: TonB-dependent receptor [Bacteroidia bacterium]|nr:TonB-dependent receptor [Bacteroidia bacterium]